MRPLLGRSPASSRRAGRMAGTTAPPPMAMPRPILMRSAPSWRSTNRRQQPVVVAPAAAAEQQATAAATTTAPAPAPALTPAATPASAAAAVRAFYDAYNRRDIRTIESLVDDQIVYSDLVYPAPKKGRSAVVAWLERVSAAAPRDLAFVIEGLAAGDEEAGADAEGRQSFGVGVKWHVALLDGQRPQEGGGGGGAAADAQQQQQQQQQQQPIIFPFSRGCSYVEVDARTGLITRVRDVVEPSSKPGDLALSLLGGLAPLIRAVGPSAAARAGTVVDRPAPAAAAAAAAAATTTSPPSSSSSETSSSSSSSFAPIPNAPLPPSAVALWLFYAGYLALAMLSDLPPGPPAYATQPEVLLEALHESVNLLWIAEATQRLGLPLLLPLPVVPSHPVSEAVFNLAVAWAAMFVPLMLTDGRGRWVKNNGAWSVAVVFVTNLFLTPWMALREGVVLAQGGADGGSPPPAPGTQRLPPYARALGFGAAAAGALCIGWGLAGRPEAGGDLAARWAYLSSYAGGDNRVFWAFILDLALFSVWQASMLAGAPAAYRFLPFGGMAAWLVVRGGGGGGEEGSSEEKQ